MLTIGIVAHSQPEFTEFCIEKLYKSSIIKRQSVDVFIVDNDCDEKTITKILELKKRYNFKLIRNGVNRGYAAACNQVLRTTQTDYIAFLHNDVLVTERTLEYLVNILENTNQEVFLALPRTNYANEAFPCLREIREKFSTVKPPNKCHITRETLEEVLKVVYDDLEDFAFSLARESEREDFKIVNETSSYCQVFRTEVLKELGGFEEDFPIRGYEDKELHLRSIRKDLSIALSLKAFAHHHGNLTTDGVEFEYPKLMEQHSQIYDTHLEQHKAVQRTFNEKKFNLAMDLGCFRENLRKIKIKNKKRILYFGSHYPPENAGGAELSFHNTAKQLLKYDIEIIAFTMRDRYHQRFDYHKIFSYEGVTILQVPEENGTELEQKVQLFIERYRPQVIYTHSVWAYYVLKTVCEKYPNIKTIFSFRHPTDITDSRLMSFLKKQGSVQIISNSKWMQQIMREKCGRDSEVVYPIVYPKQCVCVERRDPKAVVIGNGVTSKGIKDFLMVASLLLDIEFKVFGTFDKNLSMELLPQNVKLCSWTSDLKEIYKEAKIVVNMSVDPEPYGRTLIEAQMNKIPVIAYNCGGPKEIIKKGGFLVEKPEDFIPKIVSLYEDEELYENVSQHTQEDLVSYNPYLENQKLVRILLENLQESYLEGYCF